MDTVQRAVSDSEVKSVVICGQNGIFCGGRHKHNYTSMGFIYSLIKIVPQEELQKLEYCTLIVDVMVVHGKYMHTY